MAGIFDLERMDFVLRQETLILQCEIWCKMLSRFSIFIIISLLAYSLCWNIYVLVVKVDSFMEYFFLLSKLSLIAKILTKKKIFTKIHLTKLQTY